MIVSKPKRTTSMAIIVFLILTMGSFFLVLDSLLRSPDYFLIKLILAPILLVIVLFVFSKLAGNLKVISIGKEKIEVSYQLTRRKILLELQDISGWREDVVKTKNGDYKELRIGYPGGKMIKISNREHTAYDQVGNYLQKKLSKKRQK